VQEINNANKFEYCYWNSIISGYNFIIFDAYFNFSSLPNCYPNNYSTIQTNCAYDSNYTVTASLTFQSPIIENETDLYSVKCNSLDTHNYVIIAEINLHVTSK